MQVDQRYLQNIQNENVYLRQEIGKLNGALGALDEKYQRSLKQMSSIIHANQNLKNQLDSIKGGIKDQIQNSVKEVRTTYQKRIQQIMRQKDDVNVHNQNLIREKEQIQRDYTNIQQNMWQLQALKKEVSSLKKQNEKLLLQTHPLTQNQQNPQQKSIETKFSQKIEQLNNKIAQLNVINTQSKKYGQFVQLQKQKLFKQNQELQKKITQLSSSLDAATLKIKEDKASDASERDGKRYQLQALELRKHNADLTNQIQRLKLQKLEMSSQINKNEAEMHLLSTLRSLHSQLQPMRFEVEQLKRDKYYQRENGNKQKAQLQTKYLSAQHELQSLKQYVKDVQGKNKQLNQQIRQKQWQKHKIQQIEQEKRILQGRVIVYEAMEMVSRNRDKPQHVQRIQQFQRRIQLLLQEQNLKYLVNNANVHQLIAMKAYVIQLDNKLQVVAEQNQHLLKKYSQYKERYQQMVAENKQIINKHYAMTSAYKGKISGYEKLVLKLTEQLDRYIKDNQNSTIQSHYKSVITLYQSKIMSIHNQINAKKQQNRDLLKRHENLQLQLKGKLALIRELQLEISNLKTKLKEATTKLSTRTLDEQTRNSSPLNNIPQDHYKGIISQKTKQILELEQNLSKLKLKLDKAEFEYDRQLDNLKYKINRLEIQNQHLRLEQSENQKHMSTSKHSEQLGQLVQKMANIERNINAISKSQVNLKPVEQSKQIINLQYEKQIELLRHENEYLSKQLERLRNEQKRQISGQNISMVKGQMNYQQYIEKLRDQSQRNTIALQRRILELESELKIKSKQLEIKQRSSFGQSQISIQQPITQTHHLQEQNQQLRTELSRIKSSSRVMNSQSQDLMRKIREMELYTRQLKEQFQNVGAKMSEYERQIGLKDHTIYQLRFKITHLQQQHEFELENMKNSLHNSNDRHLIERQRKINDAQAELERLRNKLEIKARDNERLQIQLNRRSSQIEIIERDTKDKIRRIQQRQRQLSQQQRRLVILSQEISNREKNVSIQPIQPTISPYVIEELKSQIDELERKIKRLQQELGQKNKIIQNLEQKQVRFIREKSGLLQELQFIKPTYEQLQRNYQFNLKQIGVYKQEVSRVEGQLQSLWRDYDILKQQLRSRQRTLDDKQLQLQELKTKYDIQIRQLNQKISELQYSAHIETPSHISHVQNNQNLKYKAEIDRLTRELQNLSRQYDNIRQQLRNKQKMLKETEYQKQQMQRKYEIQIRQLNQKIRVLESKNQYPFNPTPTQVIERPSHQYNQRQIDVFKQENVRLEAQLDKLWREFDTIKMQLRNKQRQLNDAIFDREQMERKLQLQKKQYKQRIRDLEDSQVITSPVTKPGEKGIDYRQIERQFQQRIRKIEEESKQKVRQIYKENEQNTRELQQTISDLTSDLKRIKMQSLSPGGNKELDAHTNAIQSLEAHLSSLEQEIKRKSIIISQLEEDLNYYKDQLNKREEEIQKLYESTYMSSSQVGQNANQLANAQKIRLQNQIISLQNVIQRQMQTYNHDECIKKQHYLRLQIERLNGILQSRSSISNKEEGSQQHPISDNSYLLQLEQNNKKLEQDLTILRQKLIHDFDTERSIEEYLAILVITFAQVDALRQRIHELEQNFRQEHEREVNVLKQLDELKQKQLDIEKIMQILKDLQEYHKAFHEQQQRSKSTFIKKINTQILVVPGTQQPNNILDEINKNIQKSQQQNVIQSIQHSVPNPTGNIAGGNSINLPISQNLGSVDLTNSFGLNRSYYPTNLQQTGLNQPGSPQKNIFNSYAESNLANSLGRSINTGVIESSIMPSINQYNVPNMPTNIAGQGGNLGVALGTGVSVDRTYSSGGSSLNPINPVFGAQHNYRYGIFDKERGSSGQFSFMQQNQYSTYRPGSSSSIPQSVNPTLNPIFQYPGNVQQNQMIQSTYQHGQPSQNSLRLPSEMTIQVPSSGLSLPNGVENIQTPYMMSSTQLFR